MNRQELEAKVIELVAISYGRDAGELSLTTSFKENLGGASLQMVALVAELENELDVSLMLSDAGDCQVIRDLVDLVEKEL